MPIPSPTVQELLQRAHALRRLAHDIERCDAMLLYRGAGIDTWIGATPQRCLDDLLMARTLLIRATDLLRRNAVTLEQRAVQAGIAERLAVPTTSTFVR